MVKIKAALHEHLQTSSGLRDWAFGYAIELATSRLGFQSMFGVVDFDDKRYKRFIEMKGMNRTYIGDDKRAVRISGALGNVEVIGVHGEEIPTKQGHLLVMGLGYNTHLKHSRVLEDTVKEARDYNPDVVIISDHPFHKSGIGDYLIKNEGVINKIDAIEGFNGEACFGFPVGPFPFKANKKAKDFYLKVKENFPNLGFISSGDGHSWYEFCRSWTELEMPDFSSGENFSRTFRNSIQNTDEHTPHQRAYVRGVRGALDHIGDMIAIIGLSKVGLGDYFNKGVERPDNK